MCRRRRLNERNESCRRPIKTTQPKPRSASKVRRVKWEPRLWTPLLRVRKKRVYVKNVGGKEEWKGCLGGGKGGVNVSTAQQQLCRVVSHFPNPRATDCVDGSAGSDESNDDGMKMTAFQRLLEDVYRLLRSCR